MANQIDLDPYRGLVDQKTLMKYKDLKSGFKRASKFTGNPWITALLIVAVIGLAVIGFDNLRGLVGIDYNFSSAETSFSLLPEITSKIEDCASVTDKWWILRSTRDKAGQCVEQLVLQREPLVIQAAESNPGILTRSGETLSVWTIANLSTIAKQHAEKPITKTSSLTGTILYNSLGLANNNYQYVLQSSDGLTLPVYSNTDLINVINSLVGKQVNVTGGVQIQDKIIIPNSGSIQSITITSDSPKLTVLAITAQGITPKLSIDALRSYVADVDAFYSETSYGKLNFNVSVIGWQPVSSDGLTCNSPPDGAAWGDRARAALGLPPPSTANPYVYIIVPNSFTSCGLRGFETNVTSSFWLIQSPSTTTFDYPQSVFVHETGHLIGFLHEGRGSCPVGTETCASGYQQYAEDPDGDPMGRKSASGEATDFSNIHKEAKDWLTSDNIQTVSDPGGVYILNPISSNTGKVDIIANQYHLEYRPSSGIKVRTTRNSGGFNDSTLVSTLSAGATFTDSSFSVKYCGNGKVDIRFRNSVAHTCGEATGGGGTPTPTSTATQSPGVSPRPICRSGSDSGFNFTNCLIQNTATTQTVSADVANLGQNQIRLKVDGVNVTTCSIGQTHCVFQPVSGGPGSGHNITAQVRNDTQGPIASFAITLNTPATATPTPIVSDGGGGGGCFFLFDLLGLCGTPTPTPTITTTPGASTVLISFDLQHLDPSWQLYGPPAGETGETIGVPSGSTVSFGWGASNAVSCTIAPSEYHLGGISGSASITATGPVSIHFTCVDSQGHAASATIAIRITSGSGGGGVGNILSCQPERQYTDNRGANLSFLINASGQTGSNLTLSVVKADESEGTRLEWSHLTIHPATISSVPGNARLAIDVAPFSGRGSSGTFLVQALDANQHVWGNCYILIDSVLFGPSETFHTTPGSINVAVDATATATIDGGIPPYKPNYSTIDNSIAQASINGSTLTITGIGNGNTSVAIQDSGDENVPIGGVPRGQVILVPICVGSQCGGSGSTPTPTPTPTGIFITPTPTNTNTAANCDSGSDSGFNIQICFTTTSITATVSNLGNQNYIQIKMDGTTIGSCGVGQTSCAVSVSVTTGSSHSMTAQVRNGDGNIIGAFGTQLTAGQNISRDCSIYPWTWVYCIGKLF